MADPTDTPHTDDIHPLAKPLMFLANPKVVKNFIWFPLIGMIVCTLLVFVWPFDPAHKAPWDFAPSWAVIGFCAYSFLVLCAEPLFKLLARPETYYGEEVDPQIVMGEPMPALEELGEGHHHD